MLTVNEKYNSDFRKHVKLVTIQEPQASRACHYGRKHLLFITYKHLNPGSDIHNELENVFYTTCISLQLNLFLPYLPAV
jgi:hypothetical protein